MSLDLCHQVIVGILLVFLEVLKRLLYDRHHVWLLSLLLVLVLLLIFGVILLLDFVDALTLVKLLQRVVSFIECYVVHLDTVGNMASRCLKSFLFLFQHLLLQIFRLRIIITLLRT